MIGMALKYIRVLNGYNINDLSKKIDISKSYISEIENGKKETTLKIINKYSEYFKLKPSVILFFSEEIDERKIKKDTRKAFLTFFSILERFSTESNEVGNQKI